MGYVMRSVYSFIEIRPCDVYRRASSVGIMTGLLKTLFALLLRQTVSFPKRPDEV